MSKKKSLLWISAVAAGVCVLLAVWLIPALAASYDALKMTEVEQVGRSVSVSFETHFNNQVKSGSIVVQQWEDGECVQSAPVLIPKEADEIDLRLSVRSEEGYPVGVDVQINVPQHGGPEFTFSSLHTYFAFPEEKSINGWSFKSYEKGEEIRIAPGEDRILAAMAFDAGEGIRVYDCESLLEEPQRLSEASSMIVIRSSFQETEISLQESAAVEPE